jgi:hypothetical protein
MEVVGVTGRYVVSCGVRRILEGTTDRATFGRVRPAGESLLIDCPNHREGHLVSVQRMKAIRAEASRRVVKIRVRDLG